VEFMFEHTCNFKIEKGDIDPEELELELIDFGADEIFEDEGALFIYAGFKSFGAIQSYLEEQKMEILESGFERIPNVTKELNEEQQADVEKLLERLEEDDDVLNVYHSMA
ncbi:MAG: YebC/PmpR family DNA-binding transcriptional regulator, partial [Flavobacteriales bacterium]